MGAEFYTTAVWSVFARSTRAMRLSNKKSLGKDSERPIGLGSISYEYSDGSGGLEQGGEICRRNFLFGENWGCFCW